jgi:raffinose/stachyose/melibiose transport system permease protein
MKTLAVNPSEYFKRLNPLYYLQLRVTQVIPHLILSAYSMLAVVPILMILFNSLKNRKAIFSHPFQLPNSETFSLIGYETVLFALEFCSKFY